MFELTVVICSESPLKIEAVKELYGGDTNDRKITYITVNCDELDLPRQPIVNERYPNCGVACAELRIHYARSTLDNKYKNMVFIGIEGAAYHIDRKYGEVIDVVLYADVNGKTKWYHSRSDYRNCPLGNKIGEFKSQKLILYNTEIVGYAKTGTDLIGEWNPERKKMIKDALDMSVYFDEKY